MWGVACGVACLCRCAFPALLPRCERGRVLTTREISAPEVLYRMHRWVRGLWVADGAPTDDDIALQQHTFG